MRDCPDERHAVRQGPFLAHRHAEDLSQPLDETSEHLAAWPALPAKCARGLIWRLLVMPHCCPVQLCGQLLSLPAIRAGIAGLAGLSVTTLVKAAAAVEWTLAVLAVQSIPTRRYALTSPFDRPVRRRRENESPATAPCQGRAPGLAFLPTVSVE